MAGKPQPPRRRPTFQPGGGAPDRPAPAAPRAPAPAAGPPRKATELFRVSDIQQERASESPPAAPRPSEPVDLAGASTGRGLKRSGPTPSEPPVDPGPRDQHGAASPFQRFAPSAEQLATAAEARSADSLQVMAIVFGMIFMLGSALAIVGVVVGVGIYTMTDLMDDALADADSDGTIHIVDTDAVEEIVKKTPTGTWKQEEPTAPVPQGPTRGPGTILIDGDILFHSVEINCPRSGIRARAPFRNNAATAQGLPLDEECIVTFQGSQPARASLRGNQRKHCTFNPTNCRLR